jgi:drug/metabolite transporter (DMT)-like permease
VKPASLDSRALDEPPLSDAVTARILVPLAIVTLIWGSTWLVIRDQLGSVPPSWSVAYRFLIGAVAMFAYALATRARLRLSPRDHLIPLVLGAAQFALNFNFVYRAEQYIPSGVVALIFALLIIPNTLFSWIFLRQGISRRFLAGATVAIGGLALLFSHEIAAAPLGGSLTALGIALALAGVISASAANVIQATPRAGALPMASLLAWAMAWGALINAASAWAIAGFPVFDPRPAYLVGLLYLGIIGSAVTFPLYYKVIRTIGPGRAAYSSVLVPVIAMALSTLFEDYRWSWEAAVGGALTLLGLLISLSARRPAR